MLSASCISWHIPVRGQYFRLEKRFPMFHLIATLIGLYVIIRFVPPLPVGTVWKWLIAAVILLIAQYHLINRIFSGSMASPEMPVPILILAGWLFGALLLLMFFLLVRDIAILAMFTAHKTGLTGATFRSGCRTVLVLGVAALSLSAFGVWQAVRIPDIRRVDIMLKRLPTALDGIRLVQITDLHASRLFNESWTRAVVDKVNAIRPDLIVMTGDLVDGTPASRASDVAPLADLKARLGVFAVSGNHEYYSGHDDWKQTFTQLGLNFLENTHVRLNDQGHCLILAGLADPVATRFSLPAPDPENTLRQVLPDVPVILLAHQPSGAARHAQLGVDLQLSGHTHGGQILGLHWITQMANEGYISGLYRIGDMQLYVSNGTGLWSGFPLRLGKPSEITEIVLHAIPAR